MLFLEVKRLSTFPYVPVATRIRPFFEKLIQVAVPTKGVDRTWLRSIGFDTVNDQMFVGLLKDLRFIDEHGVPTQRWRDYRDKTRAPSVMAEAIRDAYAELFDVYEDAHLRPVGDLQNFFRSKIKRGTVTVRRIVNTFRELCALAEFTGAELLPREPSKPQTTEESISVVVNKVASQQVPLSVAINVQVVLPSDAGAEVYDAIFSALKRHLLM